MPDGAFAALDAAIAKAAAEVVAGTLDDHFPLVVWQTGSGTPGPSGYATVTVTGAGWTAHNLKGLYFTVTGGTGAGRTSTIFRI